MLTLRKTKEVEYYIILMMTYAGNQLLRWVSFENQFTDGDEGVG